MVSRPRSMQLRVFGYAAVATKGMTQFVPTVSVAIMPLYRLPPIRNAKKSRRYLVVRVV